MTAWSETPPVVIRAPSNLGLRPLRPGREPGTWRAPEALVAAGVLDALQATKAVELARPRYDPEREAGSTLRNAGEMRRFNLQLAEQVAWATSAGRTPVVLGGDCSILLGALAGLRRRGPVSLVHIDGHSDFRHPGNYDPETVTGAVAGMDLALATGRGELIMTAWPGVDGPLVHDHNVVQLGERESRDADWAWPDVRDTGIEQIDIFEVQSRGWLRALSRVEAVIEREADWPFWIHLDVDVLDAAFMPAVDSPGRPGLGPEELVSIVRPLTQRPRFAGLTLTVFDPDLDPDGRHARTLVELLSAIFADD